MEIIKFTYNADQKRELFGLIGAFCVDPKLRINLGAPISSLPGDIWLVAKEGEIVCGFCALTMQKNYRAKLHALMAEDAGLRSRLRKAAIKEAKSVSANALIYTVPENQAAALIKEGWVEGMKRGKYITCKKEL